MSNIDRFVEKLPVENQMIPIDSDDDVNVLEISWNPKKDSFNFLVLLKEEKKNKNYIIYSFWYVWSLGSYFSACGIYKSI